MNVVIANKYQELLINLDLDIIKNLNGEFTVEELVANFKNYYFNKMVIDVTALKDYKSLVTYQKLSVELDMSKVILLLDDSAETNGPGFVSGLISVGIYNFTRNIDSVKFLIDNPNTYKDVAQFHQLNPVMNTVVQNVPEKEIQTVYVDRVVQGVGMRVLGIRNLTDGAGATTLTYLLKKVLDGPYNVKAVELDKRDFVFFNDKSLESINGSEFNAYIAKNSNLDVLLVDLNDEKYDDICTDVVYLLEPGIIKLNKLIRRNRNVFTKYKDKKIVLNKSTLSSKDVSDFEYESGSRIAFNLPFIDDRKENNKLLEDFLVILGFNRFSNETKSKNIFNIFNK